MKNKTFIISIHEVILNTVCLIMSSCVCNAVSKTKTNGLSGLNCITAEYFNHCHEDCIILPSYLVTRIWSSANHLRNKFCIQDFARMNISCVNSACIRGLCCNGYVSQIQRVMQSEPSQCITMEMTMYQMISI